MENKNKVNKSLTDHDWPTVIDFMKQLQPDWTIDEWFEWPPDIFALTSLIFSRTGNYIQAVTPTKTWPESKTWDEDLESDQKAWINQIIRHSDRSDAVSLKRMRERKDIIKSKGKNVRLKDISLLIDPNTKGNDFIRGYLKKDDVWDVVKTLLELHALADETCRGFGIPSVEHHESHINHGGANTAYQNNRNIVRFVANNLLSLHGTLSRLSKNVVCILPKLRTPNVGMTLRYLSHHLTAHQTEAEIRWRTMPLVNIDDNIVNVLIIPWPFTIDTDRFRASTFATDRNSYENTRYFQYIGAKDEFKPEVAFDLIKNAEESIGRIHMVVLPEQALTEQQLEAFLKYLTTYQDRDKMPIVISGICAHAGKDLKSIDTAGLSDNMVYMSTFFAGKWYRMKQNKHHRWCLNEQQILQYKLGSVLTSTKMWWEATSFYQRRLSVLAPNEWFTLCPLVCEDLARLDPVSELVRGIGPTLLIALLLDGPQSKARWSGRYASVMADDPGTSVLSLSALGMTKRGNNYKDYKDGWKIIALWKDAHKGDKEISIDYDEKTITPSADTHVGVVLTINAEWDWDMTADGRHHENNSAIFTYQGVNQVNSVRKNRDYNKKIKKDQLVLSEDNDFLEITLITNLVDVAIDSDISTINMLKGFIVGNNYSLRLFNPAVRKIIMFIRDRMFKLYRDEEGKSEKLESYIKFIFDILCRVVIGRSDHDHDKHIKNLMDVAGYMLFLVNESNVVGKSHGSMHVVDYNTYSCIRDRGKARDDAIYPKNDVYKVIKEMDMSDDQSIRVLIYCSLTILWALHRRIEAKRKLGHFNKDDGVLLNKIEKLLREDYDAKWLDIQKPGHGP